MNSSIRLACVPFLLIVFSAGCEDKGPALGTVSGTITLEGEPVAEALVEFMPLEKGESGTLGRTAISAERTDSNGRYEMQYSVDRKGVLLGKHQVQITTWRSDKTPEGGNIEIKERIPKWYWGPDGVLEFDVKEGENVADFDLTKKKPKD